MGLDISNFIINVNLHRKPLISLNFFLKHHFQASIFNTAFL